MEETQFTKGMEVEICSDDAGLRGAWFTATVLRSNPLRRKIPLRRKGYQSNEKDKVYVEYHTLLANEKGNKPLREYVDAVYLRPIPPREVNRSFNLSDEVDAFYNDGWWEGVVISVLENSRYLVYFRSGKEEIEFGESELRIHREWVKGSWKPPMEEEKKVEEEVGGLEVLDVEDNAMEVEEAGVSQVLTVEDKNEGKASVAQVSSVDDKVEEADKLQESQISLENGSVQAFDTQASTPEPGSSSKSCFTPNANDKAVTSVSYNTSVPKDNDIEHIQVDGRTSDPAKLSLGYDTAEAANESNTRMEDIKRPTPGSNKISQSCKKLKESEVTDGCVFVNVDINNEIPSTSPLEGLSDHPARSLDQENDSCVLNCDGFWSHLTLSEFSMSACANIGEKECKSSKIQVECSQENIADQPTSHSSQCPDLLEQESCTKKRKRGPRKQTQVILDRLPSGDVRCRRTGKGWQCGKAALSEKIYCEKHQLEQVRHNEKRRKGPKREDRFAMDPLLPSGHPQCRRTGKGGWRCHEMASPKKIYCEKHQLEQDAYNEKRRERRREHSSLVASGSDQNKSAVLLPFSDDQQGSGVIRYDIDQHKGEIGEHETANLEPRGLSEEMSLEALAKCEQATANIESRGQLEEMVSAASANGVQATVNMETRVQSEERVSEAAAEDPFLDIAFESHCQTQLQYPPLGPDYHIA